MANRNVTASATRKSVPVVSLVHQPTTKPKQNQRTCRCKLSKLDEIGIVATNIGLERYGNERTEHESEESLERVLEISHSTGMLTFFDQFGFEFGDSDFTDMEQRFIALSFFTDDLLKAVKRCGLA
jgi:S-adenosylmethionine hydrolase